MVISGAVDDGVLRDPRIKDPWIDGVRRFTDEPVVLSTTALKAVARAAVDACRAVDGLVSAVANDAELLRVLGMAPSLERLARMEAPRWLAAARVDVFQTTGGAVACEVNSDTPTGFAETIALGDRANGRGLPGRDPSSLLEARWVAMMIEAAGCRPQDAVVGLIAPTEMTEDHNHLAWVQSRLESVGFRVVRGSPFNLQAMRDHRIGVFDTPCDLLVRHYKTDWWAQRESVWIDEHPPADAAPLDREIALIEEARAHGTVNVVNPFGTALSQNKRLVALAWEHPDRIGAERSAAVRAAFPETRFLESFDRARLVREQSEWVLKSDYGCEGEDVIVGTEVDASLWEASLATARPGRWIAQRRFDPSRTPRGEQVNLGVWMMGSMPSGVYARVSKGPTDGAALGAPVRVMS